VIVFTWIGIITAGLFALGVLVAVCVAVMLAADKRRCRRKQLRTPTQPTEVIDVPAWVSTRRTASTAVADTVVDGMTTALNQMLRGDGRD
jgi:hypothetical protein